MKSTIHKDHKAMDFLSDALREAMDAYRQIPDSQPEIKARAWVVVERISDLENYIFEMADGE